MSTAPRNPRRYRVGIDVGVRSVGLAAIAVDDNDTPTELLSVHSVIHDGGVDPTGQKQSKTRREVSGVARRTRRMYATRRARLDRLDAWIVKQGWPVNTHEAANTRAWKARAALANGYIDNDRKRHAYLSLALRHIARHRGWRNPYIPTTSLYRPGEPSDAFHLFLDSARTATGLNLPDTLTVGQVGHAYLRHARSSNGTGARLRVRNTDAVAQLQKEKRIRIRKETGTAPTKPSVGTTDLGVLEYRLTQFDHAAEIKRICEVQQIDDTLFREMIDHVFYARSPKGNASSRVGRDPLAPSKPRAPRYSDAFQRYRIASLAANLRIFENGEQRRLTAKELNDVFTFLYTWDKTTTRPTWNDVTRVLGLADRGQLRGTATTLDDGERASAKPPVNDTDLTMRALTYNATEEGGKGTQKHPLCAWWVDASPQSRNALLSLLSNAEEALVCDEADDAAAMLTTLSDAALTVLDTLRLPSGRAAYSEDTLTTITDRILSTGEDLYSARAALFNLPADWVPPAPRLTEPTGNSAVDRTIRIVNDWLNACYRQWGAPVSVNIEHGRAGFSSVKAAQKMQREMEARAAVNEGTRARMKQALGTDNPRPHELWKFAQMERQGNRCLYCNTPITYNTCEMDHIVPRAGRGCTNTRTNLAAVCRACNFDKKNTPFAVWARHTERPGVDAKAAIARVKAWKDPANPTKKDPLAPGVIARLQRATIDEEIDTRSTESSSWMATALRARLVQYYSDRDWETKVRVFRGEITWLARREGGINQHVELIGGKGKQRRDRRHHAVDACVIAMLSHTVAHTLVLRDNLRRTSEITQGSQQWREFDGEDQNARVLYRRWKRNSGVLAHRLAAALDNDTIAVVTPLRLRLNSNGRAHEDGVNPLTHLPVGSAFSAELIDRAATPQLWTALTRDPDYDPVKGLPDNPNRTLRVGASTLSATDTVGFALDPATPDKIPTSAFVAVRGGWAKMGLDGLHHLRVYRLPKKRAGAPVFEIVRVYTPDLTKHATDDLLTAPLEPSAMCLRLASRALRQALADGTATLVTWLAVGDELVTDALHNSSSARLAAVHTELGAPLHRWTVTGAPSISRLRLRCTYLSGEGFDKECERRPELKAVVDFSQSTVVGVNQVFSGRVAVIRRDPLGRVRTHSDFRPVSQMFVEGTKVPFDLKDVPRAK